MVLFVDPGLLQSQVKPTWTHRFPLNLCLCGFVSSYALCYFNPVILVISSKMYFKFIYPPPSFTLV